MIAVISLTIIHPKKKLPTYELLSLLTEKTSGKKVKSTCSSEVNITNQVTWYLLEIAMKPLSLNLS